MVCYFYYIRINRMPCSSLARGETAQDFNGFGIRGVYLERADSGDFC
jgi:hypothetical protein